MKGQKGPGELGKLGTGRLLDYVPIQSSGCLSIAVLVKIVSVHGSVSILVSVSMSGPVSILLSLGVSTSVHGRVHGSVKRGIQSKAK